MLYFHFILTKFQTGELLRANETARHQGDLTIVNRILCVLAYAEHKESVQTIANLLHVSDEFVRAWVKKYMQGGVKAGTNRKCSPGRPTKLTQIQRRRLSKIIEQGPQKSGFFGACWRTPMIQELILNKFNVLYNVRYISQLLKNMGFSYQKARFALGGKNPDNADKRQEWLNTHWPEAFSLALARNAYLFFEDEASFPQWGTLTYTWAKKGEQPTVQTSGVRKGYKVFGLVDYFTGRFFYKTIESKFNSQTYIEFLKDILSKTRKHIVLIHDGAKYHDNKAVKEFVASRANRLTLDKLPAYSPDFNPIEKVWKKIKELEKIKEEETHLHYFPTFESLKQKVDSALKNFANKGKKLLSVFEFYKKNGDCITY